MRSQNVDKTTEDYLEAILIVQQKQGYVRSVDVAEQLGVTKPSVTYTTKRLKENGYITTDHAGMLVLTESGMKIADSTYTRHRTLTELLINLGVKPETAARDACLMEHDISPESFEVLCRHAETIARQKKRTESGGKKKG